MQKSTCAYSYPTSSTSRYPSGPTTSSAFSPSANPNEDWTKISDLAERRRIQNRIAQRNYRESPSSPGIVLKFGPSAESEGHVRRFMLRGSNISAGKKLKRRLEDLERRAASPPSPQSYSDLGQLDGDFSGESWDQHLTENLAVRGPKRRQMTPESLSPGHSPAPSSTDEQQSQEYKPHFSTSPPTYAYSTYLLHDPTIYPPCPHHASQFGADPRTSGEVPFGSRYMTSSEPFHQTDLYKSNPSMMDADSLSPFNMNYAMLAGTEAQTSHSHSYLDCAASGQNACFHGNLDIETLGGAGFASQRTTREDRSWDFSGYDGLEIVVSHADDKQYTLIFKDTLLPRNPDDGREQSTISYEYDFRSRELGSSEIRRTLQIPWSSLKATYRGRVQEDAPAIHLQDIKRISLMMRR
ncbi:MAG: hypothetical protein M1817_006888 [Caeruleum heppii]|nr:MAG: hypothetical protein M1817_006888 [Caeruleum heppii]